MLGYLERLQPNSSVGEVFTDIHARAHNLAASIPVLDPQREEWPIGEVYSHLRTWTHPTIKMLASERQVRVAVEHRAPYLLEVKSLHSDDDPDSVLPWEVTAFVQRGAIIQGRRRDGFIVARKLEDHSSSTRNRPTTNVDKLKKPDRERLDQVGMSILGRLAAIRCLTSAFIAEQHAPHIYEEAQLYHERATVADVDVYDLLQLPH